MTSFPGMGEWDIGRRGTALDSKTGDAHHQLEAYFPFDPYQLPQSKKWLEGEYNTWELPHGMRADDDDDEDDDEDEVDEDDEYESDDDSLIADLPSGGGIIPLDSISISS
jgi:RNA polymerase I-specific transcription initiation factor RRN3